MTSERIEEQPDYFNSPSGTETEDIVQLRLVEDADEEYGSKDVLGLYLDDLHTQTRLATPEEQVELAKRIEAGLFAEHVLSLPDRGGLDVTDEELEWLAADGQKAKNRMVTANLRLAVNYALHRYRGSLTPSFEPMDVIQVGNQGIMNAVEGFDYTKGYRFSTYATQCMRSVIRLERSNTSRTVRLPVYMEDEIIEINRVRNRLRDEQDDEPTAQQIADELGVKPERVEKFLRYAQDPASLQKKLDDTDADATELGDTIVSDAPDPSEYVLGREGLNTSKLFSILELHEAEVLRMHFIEGLSLKQIGEKFGYSGEWARQRKADALAKLRKYLHGQGLAIEDLI